jgi:hypothetical protein
MSHISVDLLELYKTYFGNHYYIDNKLINENQQQIWEHKIEYKDYTTRTNIPLFSEIENSCVGKIPVFLPVKFWASDDLKLEIPCCTIKATSKKTIIKTVLSERMGTVKEVFNSGDYEYTIQGVLIGKHRNFPTEDIETLNKLYLYPAAIELHNALVEMFTPNCRVCVESLEWQETEGKGMTHRPFVLVCTSDYIDTLEVK